MLTREDVELNLIAFEPDPLMPKLASNLKDIYENRSWLREAPATDGVISHLGAMILGGLNTKKKFRRMDCIKLLRSIIRNNPFSHFAPETTDFLFGIYKELILDSKEEDQWRLSVLLKGRRLRPEQILWLIENASRSEHLVNRLLKYPERNKDISDWARDCLARGYFSERTSELLAKLITDRLPPEANAHARSTVMWAIYHSTATQQQKQQMLLDSITLGSIPTAIKIAMKLGLPEVIKFIAGIVPA